MLLVNKDRNFSIHEFLELIRENEKIRIQSGKERADAIRSTISKKENAIFDILIGERILNESRIKKMAVFTFGSMMYCKEVFAEESRKKLTNAEAMENFDSKGWEMLGYLRTFGFWLCLIMCCIEVLKALAKGDTKDISRVIIKYLLGYGSLYLIPWLFELIALFFK